MELLRKTRVWRAQYLRGKAFDGASRIAGWALAAAAAAAWADRAFALSRPLRWALVAAGAAALGAAAWLLLLRPWRRFRWRVVLEAAAAEFPELSAHLGPAWDLREGRASPHTSEALRRAHLARTEALLARLPARSVFRWSPSRPARRAVFAAALAGASLPWLGRSPSWERVLAPWRDVPLERYLEIAPGDARVPWGGSARVEAHWRAEAPQAGRRELQLLVDGPDGWRAARWDSNGETGASYAAEDLAAPLRYKLYWRDLESSVYALTPVSVPALESLQARLGGPEPSVVALTAAEPLSALRGTLITLSGRPNQTLAKAELRFSSLPAPLPMRLDASGAWQASFIAHEDATFRFELETPDGRGDPQPVTYSLKAVPDQPPKIELLSPLEPLAASPRDTIPIAYSAGDDGGLTRIALLVRARGLPARETLLQRPGGRRELVGDAVLDLAGLPFGKIEFQLKATDNAAPPQSALSAVGVVVVTDFDSGHARAQAEWGQAEDALKRLAAKQAEAEAKLAQAPSAEREKSLAELPEAWKEGTDAFSRWAQSMGQDAYANPGLAEAAAAEAGALEEAAKRELPEELKAARAGQTDEARRRHAALSARLSQARRLLSEGRRLQGLQDFYSEAGRMGQTGLELESALDGLSRGGSADPQTMAKLKDSLDKLRRQMDSLAKAMQALPKIDPNSLEARSRRGYELPLREAQGRADELARALARGDYAAAAELAKRLSESLAKIQRALGSAASDAEASGQSRQASERLAKTQALWNQVIDEQTRVLEKTQALGQRRLEAKLEAQKKLLAELARRQAVLVSTAEARPGFPFDALNLMKAAQAELEAARVTHSPAWLRAVAARARADAARRWEPIASGEDGIREALERGAPAPPEAPSADSRAAGQEQAGVRARTRQLQQQLEGIDADVGGLPREALEKVRSAQGEQSGAEGALSQGASEDAQSHEEAALSLLSSGSQQLSQAMSGQRSVQQGMGRGFSRGAGVFRLGGGSPGDGAELGFVPLPSAKDYLPPREIRDELKKSLEESRPASDDAVIKEYFKRISQ